MIMVPRRSDNHRLRINNWRRWRIADLHFAVDARCDFSADRDADRRCSRMGRHTAEQE